MSQTVGTAWTAAALGAARVSDPAAPSRRRWLRPRSLGVSGGTREQRDQATLLLVVAAVIAPHFEHLPTWSTLAIAMVWVWRAWLTHTHKPAPGRAPLLVLLVVATAAVWLTHGSLFGRDAGGNFLLILTALKLLEMRTRRDVMVITFLAFFVLQTQFLYDQSLLAALTMVVSVGMLFFVLLGANLVAGDMPLGRKLRYLVKILLLALPLALAFFFLFPRLPSPLLHSGGDETSAATGLSDTMSPGSIGHLLRNDAVALRARFDQRVPGQRDLYWRGPVLGHYDGQIWSPQVTSMRAADATMQIRYAAASAVDYTVTLEPTNRHELLALEYAWRIDSEQIQDSPKLTAALELMRPTPVSERLRYKVRSYTSFSSGPTQRDATVDDWLQLPEQYNPRTLEWAAQIKGRTAAETVPAGASAAALDRRLVAAVLLQFRQLPFRYNIDVSTLGRNAVDEFLFDTRVGYCEHYAASFVVLMRAMGIPARVVTGYQGGEVNPVDGYLTVHQSDAHAWAEVWLEGLGWQRVDPTAAVAPHRIEHSLGERRAEGLAGSAENSAWMDRLRVNREAIENAWNQLFLSYSADRQRKLMALVGLRPTTENVAVVGSIVLCGLMLGIGMVTLRRRSAREPLAELVHELRSKLARAGVTVPATMGLQDLRAHLQAVLDPACLPQAEALLGNLSRARYGRPSADAGAPRPRQLRAALRRWRPVRAATATDQTLTP